jgi:hypothetical protein
MAKFIVSLIKEDGSKLLMSDSKEVTTDTEAVAAESIVDGKIVHTLTPAGHTVERKDLSLTEANVLAFGYRKSVRPGEQIIVEEVA